MKVIITNFLDDVYSSILRSPVACCTPTTDVAPRTGVVRPLRIENRQPRLISPPIPLADPDSRGREWVSRSKEFTKRASSRGSFSVKRRLNAYNGYQSRRPQISAPSNFRHVDHAVPQRQKQSFRPLELSIYAPENQLSPIMPHFGTIDNVAYGPKEKELPAFPPSAMLHSRSESAMSHRIPRKPLRSSSRASIDWSQPRRPERPESLETRELMAVIESQLPRAPLPARLRSMTEPPSYERVKSALQEKRELEQKLKEIEETIEERKSIYLSSRPTSRATSRARSVITEHEPMPSPPLAPSFAERVASPHLDHRPQTAPSKIVHIPIRHKSFSEASAAFTTTSAASQSTHFKDDMPMPPPPLPLVLRAGVRPPLRKKKSFSRVSNWLFPSDQHSRNTSLDSVTNDPKPITSREGFYQCIDINSEGNNNKLGRERASFETDDTISTLLTEDEHPSPPTTWSPQSTPGRDQIASGRGRQREREVRVRDGSLDSDMIGGKSLELTGVRAFGEKEPLGAAGVDALEVKARPYVPGRNSVGVAF